MWLYVYRKWAKFLIGLWKDKKMRVKCANCGMIYDITPTTMEFRTEQEMYRCGVCPKCKSNAKDVIEKTEWKKG